MEQKNVRLFPAVLATGIMSFAGVLIETAMNVTFPTLTKEFGVSTGTVQWVTTIYLLVISIMVPLSNYLLKTYSLRRLFIVANLFFLIGLAIDVYSPSFSILLLGRLFQGASTGIALPLMFHIILNFTPLEKRGTMMGGRHIDHFNCSSHWSNVWWNFNIFPILARHLFILNSCFTAFFVYGIICYSRNTC